VEEAAPVAGAPDQEGDTIHDVGGIAPAHQVTPAQPLFDHSLQHAIENRPSRHAPVIPSTARHFGIPPEYVVWDYFALRSQTSGWPGSNAIASELRHGCREDVVE
jgi:hypothetical protein